MSGFVATPPVAPADDPQDSIANDGWFPDVSVAAVRNASRLDGTVTAQRLRRALVKAMSSINRQLGDYKAAQQADGKVSLAAVAADDKLDGQPRLVMLYLDAVMSSAKADLIEHYRDFDADGSNTSRQQDNAPAIDEERRNAQWAVRDILGQTHTVVELI